MSLKESLQDRGARLKAYQYRLNSWRRANGDDMDAWPRTPEQLKQAMLDEVTSSDWKALKELDHQTGTKNKDKVDSEDLQSRIFQLAESGLGSNSLPQAPSNLTAPSANRIPWLATTSRTKPKMPSTGKNTIRNWTWKRHRPCWNMPTRIGRTATPSTFWWTLVRALCRPELDNLGAPAVMFLLCGW